ncbi:hypothetical protein PAT3040_04413, partial [Paenibacillus agaridevorans]
WAGPAVIWSEDKEFAALYL